MQNESPLISIILATYNRSNVLRWAILSVLGQTYSNWELWVIGDACTDDTGEVVAGFSDPRIRFHNLEKNVGEQSGPNNEGCRRAGGQYIAFLNQDDLWFPDHLEKSIQHLESTNSDLVYSLVNRVRADKRRQILGIFKNREYYCGAHIPASSWTLNSSLIAEIGPWRYYKEIYTIPSQDWLYRVWKAGKKITVVPDLTVLVFGRNPGNYLRRDEEEQRILFHRMKESGFRQQELVELLFSQQEFLQSSIPYIAEIRVLKMLRALFYRLERRFVDTFRIDPSEFKGKISFQRKGKMIDKLREIRGLDRK